MGLTIYVDADACPVKQEVIRIAERHDLAVFLVSNQGMRPSPNPKVQNIMVSHGADVADDWIAEHISDGDIVITSDIPLASRCLKQGAKALRPNGKEFTDDNIGTALAMRDLHAHLRETGDISGYNPSFSKRDRSEFLQALERIITTHR